jgi:hypothetical protein
MGRTDPLARLASPPVFIFGMARSGTTWVFDILNGHPLVGGALETWLFTRHDGVAPLFGKTHWPDPGRPSSGLGRLMSRDEFVSDIRHLTGRWLSRAVGPQHQYLVEKTPNHASVLPLIDEVFPDARFIHVIRDGRDVAISVDAAASTWAPLWRRTFARSIRTTAATWKRTVLQGLTARSFLGERLLEVRYERLRADPIRGAHEIFTFAQIPVTTTLLAEIAERTDLRHYRTGEQRFRRAGEVGQWRQRWSQRQGAIFDLIAGDALVGIGYEEHRGWWLALPRRRP